ncbi:F-box domain-containing protein [Favolaschia claudopus]|uniref:F-box domain-containing protein n=1 Tax=Favolaschia claudopus TaxID=2862362 RepID=A0AAW0A4D9_9AGAR
MSLAQQDLESRVTELRQHINQLSSTIEAQRRLLMDLEEQQSEARQTLNSFLDPMARLPFEIQSQIFVGLITNSYDPIPDPEKVPLVLLGVCKLWRAVALSTPKLWAKIQMEDLPRGPDYSELCRMWLERAGSLPLSLTVHGSLWLEEPVQNLMKQYARRLDALTLYLTTDRGVDTFTRQMRLGGFHSLKTATVTSECETYFRLVNDWVQLLRSSPVLVKYSLENIMYAVDEEHLLANPLPREPLIHSSLQELRLGDTQGHGLWRVRGSSARILNYLTLPALTTLHLSCYDITKDQFTSFLARSSAPLSSLSMVVPLLGWLPGVVPEYFQYMPNLTNLQLVLSNRSGYLPLIVFHEAMRTPQFLPGLRSLTYFMVSGNNLDYQALIFGLTSRRDSALKSFHLNIVSDDPNHDYSVDLPNEECMAALRGLVSEGMEIHVGPLTRNML